MRLEEVLNNYCESLNTKIPIQWHNQGRFEYGRFERFGRQFSIQIERKPIIHLPILKNKRTAEVSFYQYDPATGDPKFETTSEFNSTEALQILGIISNAIFLKFQEYDAFYFVVKPEYGNVEQKATTYKHIADRLARSERIRVYERTIENAPAFLVSKFPVESTNEGWLNTFVEMLKQTNQVN